MIKLRKSGVAIPKYDIKNQFEHRGELHILDTRENGFNRIVKLAQLRNPTYPSNMIELLYEPHLLWMNEDRFVLTGFEWIKKENQMVDFAQSWLCKLGDGPN